MKSSIDRYWTSSFFYATYRSAGPDALGGRFEARFARLGYIGPGLFNLAHMRYTGQWLELFTGLTLDACLAQIRDESWFQP